MKYKVGDKVKIRKDLKVGEIYGGCRFASGMQKLVGKVVRITYADMKSEHYRIDTYCCYWTDEMFEDDVDNEVQEMHKGVTITVSKNKVIAYCDGKLGVARCHPDDDFNFYTGAKIALKRLEESEKPYGWLRKGMAYYIPDIGRNKLYVKYPYGADHLDRMHMERGIVFQTKKEAIECAKKMLAIIKQGD